eukprot:TRINITY_DN82412_c0_g1_i1.p1 TRINITY_DN82412_c0_g1~~TRINITY_DN82412_c0_g1_i1.p1  ORF type:complete len:327 (-),score=91.01 TRINITY_DN82412_c0_g1_i1:33-1013(-)
MPVDLTISGAMGLKAVAAAKAASAAAKQAAAQAIAMAQNTNLAALQAEQAQANLEKYVYGVPVSSVPPAVSPMPPAAVSPVAMLAIDASPQAEWAFPANAGRTGTSSSSTYMPLRARRSVPTSQIDTVASVARDLDALARDLAAQSVSIKKRMAELPQAQSVALANLAPHHQSVKDVAKETLARSEEVREKINTFNHRIEPAIKKALVFNDILKRQSDSPYNELPEEMWENSGAIITNLELARKYGKNVLASDSEDLVKLANNIALKYQQLGTSSPETYGCMLAAQRSRLESRSRQRHPSHRAKVAVAEASSADQTRRTAMFSAFL